MQAFLRLTQNRRFFFSLLILWHKHLEICSVNEAQMQYLLCHNTWWTLFVTLSSWLQRGFFLNYNIVFHLFTHSNWLFIRVVFFCNPNMTPVCSVVLIKETNMPQHINFIITHIFCPILLYVSTTKLNLLLDFFTPAYSWDRLLQLWKNDVSLTQ